MGTGGILVFFWEVHADGMTDGREGMMTNLGLVEMLGKEAGIVGRIYAESANGEAMTPEQHRKARESLTRLDGIVDSLLTRLPEVVDVASPWASVDGMSLLGSFDDSLDSENAIWLNIGNPLHVSVIGHEDGLDSDEWSFGAEWNGNVARHVSFCLAESQAEDGMPTVTVLFNEAFDENAVDVATSDGRFHLLFVQGLVTDSLSGIWRGVAYRSTRQWHEDGNGTCQVAFPTIDVMGRATGSEEGESEVAFSVSCASVAESDCRWDSSVSPRISFNDAFALFAYETPHEGYDVRRDLEDVGMPVLAMLVTDIKAVQVNAERLTDYDPHWGKDDIS